MTSLPIDNTDNGDILRSITWQYDEAENLIFVFSVLKSAYDQTTKDLFDELANAVNPNTADAFGLAVLGRTLGIPRLGLSLELYRKLIIGRMKLLNGDATLEDYREYVGYVFGDTVSVTDGLDMSLTITVSDNADDEIKTLVNTRPDVAFAFPAGVKSSKHSDSLMFGLDGQQNDTDVNVGGLDESGFNWRLTPKGNWR